MSFTLCSSGAIVRKAGAYANSSIVASEAVLADWCDQAEGEVVSKTRRDWVAGYANVHAEVKNILANCTSALAAMKVITYDMSGYTTLNEATSMLDVLRDDAVRQMEILKDINNSNDIKEV